MLNSEIAEELKHAIRNERTSTIRVLELINLAMDRKIYLKLAFPSMFTWLVKHFGYSEAGAHRRIEAARVLRVLPDVATHLAAGDLNISNLCTANSIFKATEKKTGHKVAVADKAEAVSKILKKSRREAEKILIETFPAAAGTMKREMLTTVDEKTTRLSLDLPDEVIENLNRARDLLSHVFPGGSYAQIIGRIVKEYLDRKDPLRKIVRPKFRPLASSHPPDQIRSF